MSLSPDECARELLETVPSVMRVIRAEMRSHRTPDLSVPQFRALVFVNRNAGASLSDAAEYVGVTLPSMSKLIDGLVARKLVSRQTAAEDRRRMTLVLTAKGQEVLQSSHSATQACLAEILQSLSQSERATVVAAMQSLRPIFLPRQNPAD